MSDAEPSLRIIVDDDGPGLTAEQREQVARRGRRLDETKPGSGLGLVDRRRTGQPLWRQSDARQRADRRSAGRTGAAGGV